MSIGNVPRDMPINHQQFLTKVKQAIERLQPSDIPPGRPSNVHINPLPGGNQILFTAGNGADKHLLQFSDSPVWDPTKAGAGVIDLGLSTQHVHSVGIPNVTKYYWIIAARGNQRSDPPTGPFKATTLGLAVAATPAPFIPATQQIVKSVATGKPTVLEPRHGGTRELL